MKFISLALATSTWYIMMMSTIFMTFTTTVSYGQEYDCSFQTDIPVKDDNSFILRQSINPSTSTISVELEYIGLAWVAISFTEIATMFPNVAIIGLPDDQTVLQYDLSSKDISGVTPQSDELQQVITNKEIIQDAESTILRFTRPLSISGETTVTTGDNQILVAYGTSNTLGYHGYRLPTTVTFTECIVAGTPVTPVAPTPVAVPAVAPTTPVAAPAESPTTTGSGGNNNNIVDLGNGRIQRTLLLQNGDVTLTLLTDNVAETITVTMEYLGIGWIAFAVSDDESMPNSNAIIAMPSDGTGVPQKYDIGDGRSQSIITLSSSDRQTLTDASYTQNATHTSMTFTKPLVEANELPILLQGDNFFLYAVGSDNNFGFHASRDGFTIDLSATTDMIDTGSSGPPNKTSWLVHGILMFISWSILVPLAVGTAMLRNFLPLPTGMWFKIHQTLNSIAVLCTIIGFGIAVANISDEQGDTAKHFTTIKHHKIGLSIFIFAFLQAVSGFFRPHLPHKPEPVTTPPPDEEDPDKVSPSTTTNTADEPLKKSTQRIVFELYHKLAGTAAMIMGWFNVDSGIGLYTARYGGKDLVAVPWAISAGIMISTFIFFTYDRFNRRS